MSTLFDFPCPGCGAQMVVRQDGDVECAPCDRRYHARMGHLLPLPRPEPKDLTAAGDGLTSTERP